MDPCSPDFAHHDQDNGVVGSVFWHSVVDYHWGSVPGLHRAREVGLRAESGSGTNVLGLSMVNWDVLDAPGWCMEGTLGLHVGSSPGWNMGSVVDLHAESGSGMTVLGLHMVSWDASDAPGWCMASVLGLYVVSLPGLHAGSVVGLRAESGFDANAPGWCMASVLDLHVANALGLQVVNGLNCNLNWADAPTDPSEQTLLMF